MNALESKYAGAELTRVEATGVFTGYASVFDAVDLGKEKVAPGAFARSLADKGAAGIRMLFQHNPDEPIGRWLSIAEDGRGLRVKGRVNTDVTRGREVLSLMRAGGLDGLSIGFRTVRARMDAATGVRHILEADLWEISIVTFPMLPEARIAAVKAAPLPTVRQFERWLVRDAGLTRRQARTVLAKGFAALDGGRQAASETAAHHGPRLAGAIRRAADLINRKTQELRS